MSISKLILLQKVALNIFDDTNFNKRWVSLNYIEKGLRVRYKFNTTHPLKTEQLSKALNKIEPMIGNLECKHQYGLYRAKYGAEFMYGMQRPELDHLICLGTGWGLKTDYEKIYAGYYFYRQDED